MQFCSGETSELFFEKVASNIVPMTCLFLSLRSKPVFHTKKCDWVDLAHAADSESACVRLEMQKCNVSVLVRPLFSCKCSISDHHSSS